MTESRDEATTTLHPHAVPHRASQKPSTRKDVYGSIDDNVVLQAQLLRGAEPSTTAIVAMHPIGAPGYLPMFSGLGARRLPRHRVRDPLLDGRRGTPDGERPARSRCVRRDAEERLGYERVLLAGWSGGGSLMLGYQAEAEQPRITLTAAGEYTPLAETRLPAADGVLVLAAHRSRHHLITEFLDPSITDEKRPMVTRRRSGTSTTRRSRHQPPYSADFVADVPRAPAGPQPAHLRVGQGAARSACARRARPTPSDASSCTARWPILAGSISRSTRTTGCLGSYLGDPAASSTTAPPAWVASRRHAAGCRNGASTTPRSTASRARRGCRCRC